MLRSLVTAPIQESMIFDAYLTRMERRRREPASIQNFGHHARRYVAWCVAEDFDPLVVTTDDLEDYFASMPYSPGTMRNHLKSLRAAYRYAHRRGVVDADPTVEVVIPQEPDREPRILSHGELRAIRSDCRDAHDLALFSLLAWAGLRRIEVRRLRWQDVNFKTATLTVMGKGAKLRKVPIHPELALALRELPFNLSAHVIAGRAGAMLSDGALHYQLTRLGKAQAHDFRRTVATSLYQNGVPTDTIDKIMGWAPRAIRSRYYVNIADAQLQAAMLRLYGDDPL